MKTNKKEAAASLVARLNKQYQAYSQLSCGIDMDKDERQFLEMLERSKSLSKEFDSTLLELRNLGETIKFDSNKGEYFNGKNIFRIKMSVYSEGTIEIEAPTAELAIEKAKEMAAADGIDLLEMSVQFEDVSKLV